LASSPKLSPDVKAGIEQQIVQIEAEIAGIDLEERQQLSVEQMPSSSRGGARAPS